MTPLYLRLSLIGHMGISFILVRDYITDFSNPNTVLVYFLLIGVHASVRHPKTCSIGIHNNKEFQLRIGEFKTGGLILGGIGTGKTNLRYHLISYLLRRKQRVIDFDLKGELVRQTHLTTYGTMLSPGGNMSINLFSVPLDRTKKVNFLFQLLINLLHEKPLSTAQKTLLYQSLTATVIQDGDLQALFENIRLISIQSNASDIQEQIAQALIARLDFLKQDLRSVFWTQNTKLDFFEMEGSLFFDFSHLHTLVATSHLQMLINIIIELLVLLDKIQNFDEETFIFLEEAQLMTNHQPSQITKVDEVISSLRYLGYFVFLIGTRPSKISEFAFDNGLVFLFRNRQKSDVYRSNHNNLPDFHCRVSLPSRSEFVTIRLYKYLTTVKSNSVLSIPHELDSFEISPLNQRKSIINAIFRQFRYQYDLPRTNREPNKLFPHLDNVDDLYHIIDKYLVQHHSPHSCYFASESLIFEKIQQLLLQNHHLYSHLYGKQLVKIINELLENTYQRSKFHLSEYLLKDVYFYPSQHS